MKAERRIRRLLMLGGIIMTLFSLSGCFGRSYVIGKNPKLEEITSVTASGGGMEYSSSWSYNAYHDGRSGEYVLNKVGWDENSNEMLDRTVNIGEYDFMRILYALEGCRYVRYKAPKDVMDGYYESVRVRWEKDPGGGYKVEFEEGQYQRLISAFSEAWGNNEYKLGGPVAVENITYFSFSYGPSDIAYGDAVFTAEYQEDTDEVLLTYKRSGQHPDEASTEVGDKSVIEQLADIMKQDGADCWNGFSGHDSDVLDGSGFSLYVVTQEGEEVSASGAEVYPDGFRDFSGHVRELFGKYFPDM